MKNVLLFFMVFCFRNIVAQNGEKKFHYLGESNQPILRKTIYRNDFMLDDYYIDSIQKKPYSGVITGWFNFANVPADTICVLNGFLNGFYKKYSLSPSIKTKGCYVVDYLQFLEFYDKKNRVQIIISNLGTDTSRFSANLYFYIGDFYCEYSIDYKNSVIKLKRTIDKLITINKKRVQDKFKFKNFDELRIFMLSEENIKNTVFDKCEAMGFFDKEVHIPIIKGNCNCEE